MDRVRALHASLLDTLTARRRSASRQNGSTSWRDGTRAAPRPTGATYAAYATCGTEIGVAPRDPVRFHRLLLSTDEHRHQYPAPAEVALGRTPSNGVLVLRLSGKAMAIFDPASRANGGMTFPWTVENSAVWASVRA